MGPRGAARDIDVDRKYPVDSADGRIVPSEYSAADATGTHGDHEHRIRRRVPCFEQRQFHVSGYWTGYQ